MWLVWLAIALVAALAEVASLNFFLLMFAGGALAAAAADAAGASLPVEVVVFAVVSTALIFAARPPLLRYSETRHHATGVAALVGRQAEVVEEVDKRGGRVKLSGEIWSARAEGPATLLPVGSHVTVVRIDGATAIVAAEPPQLATTAEDDAVGPAQDPDAPQT